MTLLTPNFSDQMHENGHAGAIAHIVAPHEPTREGEVPPVAAAGPVAPIAPAALAAAPGPLKVALVGTAPSSRMLAPYHDKSWSIWGCSPGNMNTLPRVDLWFELHSNLLWPEHEQYGKPYIEWLKAQTFPVYMQSHWPMADGQRVDTKTIIPNAVAFPRDELVAEFGDEFFTSSFAWQMALAIRMGASEIALFGIDMASRDEYIRQRPGFYYFKREAIKRGIKVSAPHESDIMQSPPLYAYVDSTPFGRKIMARRQEVTGRINGMSQQRDGLNHQINYLQGALEDLDYFESIWGGVANDLGRIQHENTLLKSEAAELKAKLAPPPVVFEPVTASIQITAGPVVTPRRQRRRRAPGHEMPAPQTEGQDG
jgi:hypothetical protein